MNDGQIRVVQLACVSCSATLDISQGMERLACGFCGTSQTVERSGGTISLKGVAAVLQQVQQGTDKTAAELALSRLTKELGEAEEALRSAIYALDEYKCRCDEGRRRLYADFKKELSTIESKEFKVGMAGFFACSIFSTLFFHSMDWITIEALDSLPSWLASHGQVPNGVGLALSALWSILGVGKFRSQGRKLRAQIRSLRSLDFYDTEGALATYLDEVSLCKEHVQRLRLQIQDKRKIAES